MSASRELDEPETRALVAYFAELGLTYRESVIVVLRYGLREGSSRYTHEEVSQIFKASRTRISSLEK
jgi:DNA-directed RNA polymerase sigma subunit (sigma70/sigma32)